MVKIAIHNAVKFPAVLQQKGCTMGGLNLAAARHLAPLRAAFAISRGSKSHAETVRVEVSDATHTGRGESVPYARYGETVETTLAAIEALRPVFEAGRADRAWLQTALPAGAARCALDCALWDLEAKRTGVPVWRLAELPEPGPIPTSFTVTLGPVQAMAEAARRAPGRLLKLKLGGPEDLDRVAAVRAARPDARLILDGNEGIAPRDLSRLCSEAERLGVILIEQPLPAAEDHRLGRGRSPVTLCADESVHVAADIPRLSAHFDAVNLKLDKTGGLTEALHALAAARAAGLQVMVGCMVCSSLGLAPAVLLAQAADLADLDGPLWLADDIADGLSYADGQVAPPTPALWG